MFIITPLLVACSAVRLSIARQLTRRVSELRGLAGAVAQEQVQGAGEAAGR